MAENMGALKGSIPINKHQLIGPADPNQQIEVTIKLRRKTEAGLPTLEAFVAGKRAKLTRQELSERYGSNREDANAVQRWAVSQGLSVTGVDLGKREMHLTGSTGAMSRAFGVKLSMYKHSRTRTEFRCPESEIQIPQSLQTVIRGVFGLDNMPVVVRHGVRVARKAPAAADPKKQNPGAFYPNEVAKLYNFPPTQGDGQRVAVLEFGGGFDQSVLADYFKKYVGLAVPPTVNAIPVGGAQMDIDDGATGEVYLDIEVIGAMAPKATIDVYFAPWSGEGDLNSIQQAIQSDNYAAVSISYGLDEDASGSGQNPGWAMLNRNLDEAFRDATAVGIPLFVSTGDQGGVRHKSGGQAARRDSQ